VERAIDPPPAAGLARTRARLRLALTLGVAALVVWALLGSLFAVDVTEYGLVTRFGNVVRVVGEPGLHIKLPFDRVMRLDRRLSFSQPPPAEYLTVDKRNIVVESLATWRIADPERFLATVATRSDADVRLADVVVGEIGSVLGTYPATSLIAPDGNAERFRRIVSEIRARVAGFARTAYGIEILDVELLHLTLPNQNREHVFERMKAERGKMAKEYRTEGERQARKIVAEADREKSHIEAEAYAQVQRLKGEGDAEAARIYSAAFSQNPAFYKFLRTLQAYGKFVDENTTLFLPGDAEVLRMLNPSVRAGGGGPLEAGSATVTAKPKNAGPSLSIARHGRPAAGSAPSEDGSRGLEPSPR
jgi:membrane protease subunit HflC